MSPAKPPALPIRCLPIRALGELQVGPPESPCALPASRKTRALLAYLAVTARRHQRSALCALFWEGADDPRAGLRWSLTQLRNALGNAHRDLVVANRESVALQAGLFDTDINQLETLALQSPAAKGGLSDVPRDALLASGALFRGEFLDGLDLPACYAYHEWCMAEREAASRSREQILLALIEHDRSQPEQVLGHARALVALNPLNERGHIELIGALGALGRGRDARAQHARGCRIFETELGIGPPAGLEEALAAIDIAKGTSREDDVVEIQVPLVPGRGARMTVPLSGREEETAQLANSIARAADGLASDVLLLSGVAGIGKTRLLDEFESLVQSAGGRTLRGRSFEIERLRPFGFWIDALRGLGAELMPPVVRASLRPLLQPGAAGVEASDRDRLFDAVRVALEQLARAGPVAVLVDDLQSIEDSSAALLHYVIRQLAGAPVFFALAGRAGELDDNTSAQQLIAALAGEQRLQRIALGPLDDAAARKLVEGIAPAADAARIIAQARGHPLMLIELARSSEAPDGSTGLLDHILATRLSPLSPRAGELLGWASAFGPDFPVEVLIAAQGLSPGSVDAVLSELERHDLICATGDAGYAFSHDLIRQAAYGRISQPRRRLMHKAIALSLSAELETNPEGAAELAHHAGLGAQHALAARASVRAGEHGLRMFANREAAELARRGRGHAQRVADPTERARLEMALLRIQVLATASQPHATLRPDVSSIEQAIAAADNCRLHDEVAQGHYLLSVVHQEAGDIDAARQATLLAAGAAERSGRLGRARQLANSARCLVELGRDIGRARGLVAEAQTLADAAGVHEIEVRWCRGLLHHWDGELDLAVQELDQAIALADQQQDRWRQTKCLAAAAVIEFDRGAAGPALQRATALGMAAGQLGDTADAPLSQVLVSLAQRMADGATEVSNAAIAALRAADDKASLAGVLNIAAEIECELGNFELAVGLAAEALALAEATGAANEAVLSHASLARAAMALGDRQGFARSEQALQSVLEAPAGFSARAALAAADAIVDTSQAAVAQPGSVH